jgi:hypothetical protein
MKWWQENADSIAVILAVAGMSVLGTADLMTPDQIVQTLPAVLGVFAVTILRDRSRSDKEDVHISRLAEVVQRTDRRIDGLSASRLLVGKEIGETLAAARRDTAIWIFRGGTGTYTRAVTLPACIEAARPGRRVLQVRLEILDPSALSVCEEYARLYRRLALGPEDDAFRWTGDGTRRESYATVLAACWHKQRYAPLQIEVGLSSDAISTFRYDMSSKHLIITQRGPRFEAVLMTPEHPHYEYWRFELDLSFERSTRVPLGDVIARYSLADMRRPAAVRSLFRDLRIELPDEYTDDDVAEIVLKATEPESGQPVRGAGELVSTPG